MCAGVPASSADTRRCRYGLKVQVTVAAPAPPSRIRVAADLRSVAGKSVGLGCRDQRQHPHLIRSEPLRDGDQVRYRAAVSLRSAV